MALVTVDGAFGGWGKAQARPLRATEACSTRSISREGERAAGPPRRGGWGIASTARARWRYPPIGPAGSGVRRPRVGYPGTRGARPGIIRLHGLRAGSRRWEGGRSGRPRGPGDGPVSRHRPGGGGGDADRLRAPLPPAAPGAGRDGPHGQRGHPGGGRCAPGLALGRRPGFPLHAAQRAAAGLGREPALCAQRPRHRGAGVPRHRRGDRPPPGGGHPAPADPGRRDARGAGRSAPDGADAAGARRAGRPGPGHRAHRLLGGRAGDRGGDLVDRAVPDPGRGPGHRETQRGSVVAARSPRGSRPAGADGGPGHGRGGHRPGRVPAGPPRREDALGLRPGAGAAGRVWQAGQAAGDAAGRHRAQGGAGAAGGRRAPGHGGHAGGRGWPTRSTTHSPR